MVSVPRRSRRRRVRDLGFSGVATSRGRVDAQDRASGGAIVVIIGLCLLMFDAKAGLMNPLRFALLLTNFGSVMTWGVVFLGGFTVISLVVVVLDFVKKRVPVWLDIAGVVFGVAVAMYTGAAGRVQDVPAVEQRAAAICSSCRHVYRRGVGAAHRHLQAR